MNITPFPGFSW